MMADIRNTTLSFYPVYSFADNLTNTSDNISLSSTPSSLKTFSDVVAWVDYLFVPIVFSLGAVGNTFSFLVFVFSHISCHSSSIYLAALSVTDTGFLFCVFVSWANNIGIHWHHENGWCQAFVYLGYVFSFLSVWYVVSFTVERYIAVCFPFKRHTMCTVRRARLVVTLLAAFALIAYNFAIWTSKVSGSGVNKRCSIKQRYFPVITLTSGVDSVLTLIVPCVIIFILNLRIIFAAVFITKQLRGEVYTSCPSGVNKRRPEGSTEEGSHAGSIRSTSNFKFIRGSGRKTRSTRSINSHTPDGVHSMAQVKVTKMLVIVSSAFLLLNLPSHLLRLYGTIMPYVMASYRPSWLLLTLQKLFTYIYYVNFSINFFLYAACGKNFRQALCRSVAKICHCLRRWVICKPIAHQMSIQLNQIDPQRRAGHGHARQASESRKADDHRARERKRSKTRSTML